MSQTGSTDGASFSFRPDSWKEKSESDYALTEGMTYELFSTRYQSLLEQSIEQRKARENQLGSILFVGEEELLKEQDEELTEYLFLEVKREINPKNNTDSVKGYEIALGGGFLIILFFVLWKFTFQKKDKKKTGGYA